jgi:lysophospholipase L1-like esterase
MVMEGINDIGLGARQHTVNADMLIGAMRQIIERAHTHGIKVVGCTLTPYVGASYASDEGEAIRTALNTFIRSGAFDAVVDYDQITRDPNNPTQLLKEFNNTDHLHPNDAGYKAMADSVDLSIFAPNSKASTSARKR